MCDWLWCPNCQQATKGTSDGDCPTCKEPLMDGGGLWQYDLMRKINERMGGTPWPAVPQLGQIYTVQGGIPSSEWVWCLHCERVSLPTDWKVKVDDGLGLLLCPYEGCNGGLYGDGWDYRTFWRGKWDYALEHGHDTVIPPVNPERDVVYPLY